MDKPQLDRDRNPLIDAARGIAMMLVLLGHALEMFFSPAQILSSSPNLEALELWRWIYSFHMPAFYFVSGMTAIGLARKPAQTVFATALGFILLASAIQLLVGPIDVFVQGDTRHAADWKDALLPVLSGTRYTIVVTWFLVSLALVQILAWSILRSSTRSGVIIMVVASGGFLFGQFTGHNCFQVQSWSIGAIFFLSGRYVFAHMQAPPPRPRDRLIALTGACLAFLGVTLTHGLNHGCAIDPNRLCDTSYGGRFAVMVASGWIGYLPLFFCTALAGIAGMVFFTRASAGTALERGLAWIGRNALTLLILNGFVLKFLEPPVAHLLGPTNGLWPVQALLLALAQLAVLPLIRPLIETLQRGCKTLAGAIVKQGLHRIGVPQT